MPQPGEAMRLDNQEGDDQRAHDHQLDMGGKVGGPAKGANEDVFQKDRQQDKEGRTRKAAKNRPEAANDDHEQHQEGFVNPERLGHFGGA